MAWAVAVWGVWLPDHMAIGIVAVLGYLFGGAIAILVALSKKLVAVVVVYAPSDELRYAVAIAVLIRVR